MMRNCRNFLCLSPFLLVALLALGISATGNEDPTYSKISSNRQCFHVNGGLPVACWSNGVSEDQCKQACTDYVEGERNCVGYYWAPSQQGDCSFIPSGITECPNNWTLMYSSRYGERKIATKPSELKPSWRTSWKTQCMAKDYKIPKYYADNGCASNDTGVFQSKFDKAFARCCYTDKNEELQCKRFNCEKRKRKEIPLFYDEAAGRCKAGGQRLCTKEELLDNICCSTEGMCNNGLVWTSTPDPEK